MKLKICHISDTHGKHKGVQIPECDILICSGDISPIGELWSIKSFLRWLTEQHQATYKIFTAGNHDRLFDRRFSNEDSYENLHALVNKHGFFTDEKTNNIYLQNNYVNIMGIKIWGSPISPWFHGDRWAFNKRRGDEIEEVWKQIPHDTDILVTHGPPRYKLDKLFRTPMIGDPDDAMILDGYAGCDNLAFHVKRVRPFIHLFGHIHEGYGYEADRDTHYFNGSICNLRYEPINKPWLIEADFKEREISIIT